MKDEAFDALMARLDSPLAVVTTVAEGEPAGCVAGFHTQCSIDPIRYAVWLSKANFTYRVGLFATHLAVHFLGSGDRELAELFGGTTGDEIDKFARCEWTPGPGGVPLLTLCPDRIVLRRAALWDDGSDHVCIVADVIAAQATADLVPMRLSAAHDIEAGHPAKDAVPPPPTATATATATDERDQIDLTTTDEATRHRLEDLAAGAGHPVDLSVAPDDD